MTAIVWDQVGERLYETGLDRGVLYLASGLGVPWNGLSAITEKTGSNSVQETYYDGIKNMDIPLINDFYGSIKAVTYPDEFLEYEGIVSVENGMFLTQQNPKTFGLSYRTLIGNDVESQDFGYKIHILYDLMAVPQDTTFNTLTDSPSLVEFNWNVTSRPQLITGYKPTAHVILDTRTLSPDILQVLENRLYGTVTTAPNLPSLLELRALVTSGTSGSGFITITDNGNGTWTATVPDSQLTMIDATTFQITGANAVFLTADTYQISTG